MGRDVSVNATDAIVESVAYKYKPKLTIYNSRSYFEAFTDYSPEFAKDLGESGNPVGEAATYIPSIGKSVSVSIDDEGKLVAFVEDHTDPIYISDTLTPISVTPGCRPGLLCVSDDGEFVLVYWYSDGWKQGLLLPGLLIVDIGDEAITDVVDYSDLGNGAIYPVSKRGSIILHFVDGGILPTFIDDDLVAHHSPSRFMNPTKAMNPSEEEIDDYFLAHYAGAAQVGDQVFVYFSHYDGSVRSIVYKIADNLDDGVWSDIRTAIPQDLSKALISNVVSYNGRVFICGKFSRTEEFSSNTVWTLLPWSDDGLTFSMDRRILCSPAKLRFMFSTSGTSVIFSSENRWARLSAPYQVAGEDTPDQTEIETITVDGSPDGDFNFQVTDGKEQYRGISYIDTGSYARLDFGIFTSDEVFEMKKYYDLVVSKVSKKTADGSREFNLSCTPDGRWHTSMMTYPFYMEILGRQAIYDSLKDFSNLYKQDAIYGQPWALSCDFWMPGAGGYFNVATHEGTTSTTHWCADLKGTYRVYPKFGSDETYEFKIFGWSRAGVPEKNPNEVDTTDTATLNDTFSPTMTVIDTDGTTKVLICSLDDLASDHDNPPQTYFTEGARAGSYPVIFNFPNPGLGVQIVRLGVIVSSDDDNTTYYLERIEMPGIIGSVKLESYQDTTVIDKEETTGLLEITQMYLQPYDYYNEIPEDYIDTFTGLTVGDMINSFVLDGDNGAIELVDNKFFDTFRIQLYNNNDFNVKLNAHFVTTGPSSRFGSIGIRVGEFDREITVGGLDHTVNGPYDDSGEVELLPFETWRITVYNFDNQFNFFPPYSPWVLKINLVVTEANGVTPEKTDTVLVNSRKGVPQIYFSTKPYTAFNFESSIRASFHGEYSYIGLIGLGTDAYNFVLGYIKKGKVGIASVRDGIKIVLNEFSDAAIAEDTYFDIRFWHRDGKFGVEYKSRDDAAWPMRGSQAIYDWTVNDGPMALSDDVLHVGIFSQIEPPKFMITGFESTGTVLGVMPLDMNIDGDSEFLAFPSAANVDVDGIIYSYASKVVAFSEGAYPRGPYQLRNVEPWGAPFNTDVRDSYVFQGGLAIEFTLFDYLDASENYDLFTGKIIASDGGYAWINEQTMFDPWITTVGEVVMLHNRCRSYTAALPDHSVSGDDKIWIANALAGMKPVKDLKNTVTHVAGSFAYLDTDDKTRVSNFFSSSGDHDQTVATLIDVFARTSGTKGEFTGDTKLTNITLDDGEEVEIG